MITTAPDRDLHSIGAACQLLQVLPRRIEHAAEALDIAPLFKINGVPHYSAGQLERIAAHIRESK